MSLPSKREFLSLNTNPDTGKPFAVFPGRGRFSAEAEAFAAANADKWAAEAPKAPAKPRVPKVAAPVGDTGNPTNGAEAAAAALARREAKQAEIAEDVKKGLRAPTPNDMPKRRPQNVGYVVEDGNLFAFDRCRAVGCGQTIAKCACDGGPKAPTYKDTGIQGQPLLLTRPDSLASV